MKKLFFTAIAVVAFSTVSMANTKEVKTMKKRSKIEKKNFVSTDCNALYSCTYLHALNHGATRAQAQSIALATCGACWDLVQC